MKSAGALLNILVLTFAMAAHGQTRIEIQPLDFQDEQISETLMQHIYSLEARGNRILIRSENNYITEIDANGRFLGKIGPVDFGSSHFQRIGGMAVSGDRILLLNLRKTLFIYEGDALLENFSPDAYHASHTFPHLNSNSPGFNGEQIVIAKPKVTGMAASVYSTGGRLIRHIPDPVSFSEQLENANPAIGASFWLSDGSNWYCLFKFKPIFRVYDASFNLLGEYELSSESITEAEERLYDPHNASLNGNRLPKPHFSDFKMFGSKLYAMSGSTLLEIDPKKGRVTQSWQFFGRGEDFADTDPWRPLTLPVFAFLEDGTLVLGHPNLLWNHDLWRANIFALN